MTNMPLPYQSGGDGLPDRGPYDRRPWFTQTGQADAKREARHELVIRQAHRDVEVRRVEIAKALDADLNQMNADARRLSEIKYTLHRAKTESTVLAGDDAELSAKFAIIDDDFFHALRVRSIRGMS